MERILIVEDDVHINRLIQQNLKLVGYECVGVENGKEMQEALRENRFDLILLDVMLPGMSGFSLIEHCKGIPAIFVNARGELDDKIQGLSLGAEDYIVKPFEMLELIARVKVVLRRFKQSAEIYCLGDVEVNLDWVGKIY